MPNYRHLRRLEKLRNTFEKRGIRPLTKRGQNFLLDKNQVNYIARLGDLRPEDVVLEVGPGTGFLTGAILEAGARLLAVELDKKLAAMTRDEHGNHPGFEMIEADILAGKNEINPTVLERLREKLAEPAASAAPVLKTVSNLPYSAGTPFVANLFSSELPWERAIFLIQYEVAERMIATPGRKEYGALSIVSALGGKVKLERKVPPQVFWPRPRVESAVVSIRFNSVEERLAIPWKSIRRLTVSIFSSRRKRLRNSLKGTVDKQHLDSVLASCGLEPESRGETLLPAQFMQLAQAIDALDEQE